MHAPHRSDPAEPFPLHPGPGILLDHDTLEPCPAPEGLTLAPGLASAVEVRALDTWSSDLAHAGLLLLQDGAVLRVVDRRDPSVVHAEGPSASGGRFAWDLPEGVRQAVADAVGVRALLPVATLRGQVRRWEVRNEDDKIVARLLDHTWQAGGRTLQVLQLRGYADEAERLRGELPEATLVHPLSPALASVLPEPRAWSVKAAVEPDPAQTAQAAAIQLLLRLLELSDQTVEGIRENLDTEFLHDYRVALRQARSLLSVLKRVLSPEDTREIKDALRDLAAPTAVVRDLDVHLLARSEHEARVADDLRPGLEALFEDLEATRAKAWKRLASRMGKKRYREEMDGLRARIAGAAPGPLGGHPIRAVADRRVRSALGAMLRKGRAVHPGTPIAEIHELRIAAKRLRYTLELFRPLYDARAVDRLVQPLKGLQDALGEVNDRLVQRGALLAWARLRPEQPVDAVLSVGALAGALDAEQRVALERLPSAFGAFDRGDLDDRVVALIESAGSSPPPAPQAPPSAPAE